jgi:hypothetical protein
LPDCHSVAFTLRIKQCKTRENRIPMRLIIIFPNEYCDMDRTRSSRVTSSTKFWTYD